jgi:diacylglycerol kinase family enzyme
MPRRGEALVCLNRSSGGIARDDSAVEDIRLALQQAGVAARVELVAGSGIAEQAKRAVAAKAELLIVGGGDGTVSAAAAVLAGTATALAILPFGTLNHLARDLGIPLSLNEAASLIASGAKREIDVAEVNGRTFVNNSSIGLYPLMVIDREAQQRRLGRSKRLAMAVAAARTLVRFNNERLTLSIGGKSARLDTPLLFVGNNEYRISLPAAGRRNSLEGGRLSVLVMRKKTRVGFIAAALRALAGRARADDMVHLPPVESLDVDSTRAMLTVSIDGEAVQLRPPLSYRMRKHALRVIAP